MKNRILETKGLTADQIESKVQEYHLEDMGDAELEEAVFKPLRDAMIKSQIDSRTWQDIVDSIYMEQGIRRARAETSVKAKETVERGLAKAQQPVKAQLHTKG